MYMDSYSHDKGFVCSHLQIPNQSTRMRDNSWCCASPVMFDPFTLEVYTHNMAITTRPCPHGANMFPFLGEGSIKTADRMYKHLHLTRDRCPSLPRNSTKISANYFHRCTDLILAWSPLKYPHTLMLGSFTNGNTLFSFSIICLYLKMCVTTG